MSCPVRLECLDYRERTGSTDGIWGGITTKRGSK
ncbi:WhiB family transcription factor [Gordonia phage Diabla]|nr:WhiB family transcription factor [Gordonia phage Diabla]